MKAVIIYESMYGNTRAIAEAIGEGLSEAADVTVTPVADASQDLLRDADLVLVGGPTHVHGMSRPATRKSAIEAAAKPGSPLRLQHDVGGPGVRDWLAGLGRLTTAAAAFDTRLSGPPLFTGQAAKGIASQLRRHGLTVIAEPESFLVTKTNKLYPGELVRAREWGVSLTAKAGAVTPASR
jgi:hypothetical protein